MACRRTAETVPATVLDPALGGWPAQPQRKTASSSTARTITPTTRRATGRPLPEGRRWIAANFRPYEWSDDNRLTAVASGGERRGICRKWVSRTFPRGRSIATPSKMPCATRMRPPFAYVSRESHLSMSSSVDAGCEAGLQLEPHRPRFPAMGLPIRLTFPSHARLNWSGLAGPRDCSVVVHRPPLGARCGRRWFAASRSHRACEGVCRQRSGESAPPSDETAAPGVRGASGIQERPWRVNRLPGTRTRVSLR